MPTQLLNDDQTASMATLIMCSHHAFRRDIACFARALASFDATRAEALRDEWAKFRAALHGHHTVEDTAIFPDLRGKDASIAGALDELEAQHRAIDPLLARGDELFANLVAHVYAARTVIDSLATLLDAHLELEERTVIPHLRSAKEFLAPMTDDMIPLYADGFAWSSGGIADAVLAKVFAMLPPALAAKIPAARVAFDERSRRVWGYTHAGASVTSVPTA